MPKSQPNARSLVCVCLSLGFTVACGDSDSSGGSAGTGGANSGGGGSSGNGGTSGSSGSGGSSGGAGGVAGSSAGGAAGSGTGGLAGATGANWPGHQPGKILLGMSAAAADWNAKVTELSPETPSVRRKFYEWNEGAAEDTQIAADHAAHRIPWISFKPPDGAGANVAARWAGVAAGGYDADIKARAQRYAKLDRPVIVTFHHEPSNDAPEADGVKWADAWIHIYDVMQAETGLANCTFAPILGDWLFNAKNNGQDPENWVTSGVIGREPFLGIDLYQNDSGEGFQARLEDILQWLADHGAANTMVGIGEVGATDFFHDSDASAPTALEWWNASWQWASTHTDRIGVISYFNSTRNSKPDHVWDLDESPAKLAAYKAALASPAATTLP